jgi:uncharacterized protein (DUF736 family)
MIIGKFQQESGAFVGKVTVFAGTAEVRITPTDLKGIDYLVTLPESGIELGVAWNRKSKKGTEYVSALLDSPLLPAAASCALFKQDDGGYHLVWDRPEKKEQEQPAAKPAAA